MLALRVPVGVGALAADFMAQAPTVGIVGPSGGGKTTLLRVLAGVETRARGRVRAFGEDWLGGTHAVPPWRRGVGWVPQEALLFPHLDVRSNLSYAGDADLDEVVDLLDVRPLLPRMPRKLSGGERQRVALGRALLARPRLLLLDEPFAALDRPLRARLSGALAAWCAARGTHVVLVTHDERDLDPFETDRLTLRDGRLDREGPSPGPPP